MHNALQVLITDISDTDIADWGNHWMTQWSSQVPLAIWRELIQQGEVLRDIMQWIILLARFEDVMPDE